MKQRLFKENIEHRDYKLGVTADPVIKAIAKLEFKDGLRMGVFPGGCWYPCDGST